MDAFSDARFYYKFGWPMFPETVLELDSVMEIAVRSVLNLSPSKPLHSMKPGRTEECFLDIINGMNTWK